MTNTRDIMRVDIEPNRWRQAVPIGRVHRDRVRRASSSSRLRSDTAQSLIARRRQSQTRTSVRNNVLPRAELKQRR